MAEPFQRIWHGDSRMLLQKIPDGKVKSLITDPPFGVNNQSNSATTPEGKAAARKIANDESPEQAKLIFEMVWEKLLPKMMDESDLYVFTSYQVLDEWLALTRELFEPHGYKRKALLVWEKDGPGQGDLNTWGMGVEFCIYFKRGNWIPNDQRRNAVLHTPQLRPGQLIHPHEKPTALLEGLIKHSTKPGEFVVDPFGGSGSLARAARNLKRSALCIELDEFNYKEARRKFEQEGDGLGF